MQSDERKIKRGDPMLHQSKIFEIYPALMIYIFDDFNFQTSCSFSSTATSSKWSSTLVWLCVLPYMYLKHFCLSWGKRVLKRTESTLYWVYSSGMYPYTLTKKFIQWCLSSKWVSLLERVLGQPGHRKVQREVTCSKHFLKYSLRSKHSEACLEFQEIRPKRKKQKR